jgi:glycogen synthase
VHQKGVDLAIEAAESILDQGGQLVVTGCGEPRFERAMHPDHAVSASALLRRKRAACSPAAISC